MAATQMNAAVQNTADKTFAELCNQTMDAETGIHFPNIDSSFSPSFEVAAPFLAPSINILAAFTIKEVRRDFGHTITTLHNRTSHMAPIFQTIDNLHICQAPTYTNSTSIIF